MASCVIIDTDPGVDDSMALLLAMSVLRSRGIRLLGLTIVHGNLGGVEGMTQLMRNARRVLRLARSEGVPVIRGADRPIMRDVHAGAPFVHGNDGLGDVGEESGGPPEEVNGLEGPSAAEWIVAEVMRHPAQSVALVALGPLTNVAQALQIRPQIGERLHSFHCMGGSFFVPGNISPLAEANFYNDPEAADLVLRGISRVFLAPLDLTTRIRFDAQFTARLAAVAPKVGGFIEKISRKYLQFHADSFGGGRAHADVHDSSAVASFLWPDLFTRHYDTYVRVNCADGHWRGHCYGDFRGSTQNANAELPKNCHVLLQVNSALFLERYVEAIQQLEAFLDSEPPRGHPFSVKGLDHVNLQVEKSRFGPLVDFYVNVLGLKQGPRPKFGVHGVWLYPEGGNVAALHLVQRPDAILAPPRDLSLPVLQRSEDMTAQELAACTKQPRQDHFCLESVGLESFIAKLKDKGVSYVLRDVPPLENAPTRKQVHLRDPDGNLVEITFLNE